MTLWELAACIEGFKRANGVEPEVDPPSPEEFEEILRRHAKFVEAK